MEEEGSQILNNFLKQTKEDTFDLVSCFSTTMWIHLNYGDEGLFKFLKKLCSISNHLIIEPQPWQCYKNASKRHKKLGMEPPALFSSLRIRNNVEEEINSFITNQCQMQQFMQLGETQWKRKILWYKRVDVSHL